MEESYGNNHQKSSIIIIKQWLGAEYDHFNSLINLLNNWIKKYTMIMNIRKGVHCALFHVQIRISWEEP